MGGSLPDMGDWDAVFDETYLQTYEPFVDPDRTRAEALGAAGLADVVRELRRVSPPDGANWTRMLREAGFAAADVFGGWDGETPMTPDRWRLILRAR
jgi:hypothetical protein